MNDKWEDEAVGAECEWEDEPVNIDYYSDHRRGDLDSYPTIAVCDGCAAELDGDLGGRSSAETGRILVCQECGASNAKPDDAS